MTIFRQILFIVLSTMTLPVCGKVSYFTVYNFGPDMGQYSRDYISKMVDVALLNERVGDAGTNRFVLYCEPVIVDKEILSSVIPAMYKVRYSLMVYVGDNYTQKKFNAISIDNLIGVDKEFEKATIQAFKKVNSNTRLKNFVEESSLMIENYFKKESEHYLQNAKELKEQYLFDSALFELSLIPDFCDSAFLRAKELKLQIVNAMLEYKCESLSRKLDALIAADKYEEATSLIFQIPPSEICDKKISGYLSKIEKHWCSLKINEAFAAWIAKDMEALKRAMIVIDDNSPCREDLKRLKSEINKQLSEDARKAFELKMIALQQEESQRQREYNLARENQRSIDNQRIADNQFRLQELKTRREISLDQLASEKERIKAAERIALSKQNSGYGYLKR